MKIRAHRARPHITISPTPVPQYALFRSLRRRSSEWYFMPTMFVFLNLNLMLSGCI
jgi:hypothetical protein